MNRGNDFPYVIAGFFSLFRIQATAVLLGMLLQGCVTIPDEPCTTSGYVDNEPSTSTVRCEGFISAGETASAEICPIGFDPDGLRVLIWNSYKGKMSGWEEDLQQFLADSDLVLLQEGYLAESLQELLSSSQYNWNQAVAFTYKEVAAGVLTAARVVPDFACSIRETEPLSRIPKTVLFTRYPFKGTQKKLLVANLHLVNFSSDLSAFRNQLAGIQNILSRHPGPVIMAGDFNTWTRERVVVVEETAGALNLQPIDFVEDHRVTVMGHTIDYLYYRGLIPTASSVVTVSTSDHNPILVTFTLEDGQKRAY